MDDVAPPERVVLRLAEPSDVHAIADLARAHIERGLAWTWHARRVARALSDKSVLGVVADDGALAGFCIMEFGAERAHLLLMGVQLDARRTGVGGELLRWQLECVRTAGLAEVRLELRAGNVGALRFYESLGFVVTRRIRRYYQGREDALRMALVLR